MNANNELVWRYIGYVDACILRGDMPVSFEVWMETDHNFCPLA
jgi:hypothetical protein